MCMAVAGHSKAADEAAPLADQYETPAKCICHAHDAAHRAFAGSLEPLFVLLHPDPFELLELFGARLWCAPSQLLHTLP